LGLRVLKVLLGTSFEVCSPTSPNRPAPILIRKAVQISPGSPRTTRRSASSSDPKSAPSAKRTPNPVFLAPLCALRVSAGGNRPPPPDLRSPPTVHRLATTPSPLTRPPPLLASLHFRAGSTSETEQTTT
jgi:hypothetical protein